jgi:hypothetical protein
VFGKKVDLPVVSVYEQHSMYLKKVADYASLNGMEPFVVLETTRGCPYQCTFCEWGGGIGTKITKKELEIVKRDIIALRNCGYRDIYLTDANFGVFEDRDIEIFRFAFEQGVNLTDISTVKSKDLKRRTRLVDAWFDIAGLAKDIQLKRNTNGEWRTHDFISVVPTVSIQSISDSAMKIAKRVDLTFNDKITLSKHIHEKCAVVGFPVPSIELILGMPGSTLNDFYREMEIIWNFKAWNSFRHDYMFLPDSEISDPKYLEEHSIQLVDVYTDLVDEQGVDNLNGLYAGKKNYFKTIRSCFSFTTNEMCEMFLMNLAGNTLLKDHYPNHLGTDFVEFGKACFTVLMRINEFQTIFTEISDILDNKTPARSIKKLLGENRNNVVNRLLTDYKVIIASELFKELNYG